MIFTLQSHEIAQNWHRIEPFLRFESYDWTPDEVCEDLKAARAQLWGIADDRGINGIIVTRINESPRRKVGLLWIASGNGLEEGIGLLDAIEQWFKSQGCDYIEIQGRKGWGRVLDGYEAKATVFVKVITW